MWPNNRYYRFTKFFHYDFSENGLNFLECDLSIFAARGNKNKQYFPDGGRGRRAYILCWYAYAITAGCFLLASLKTGQCSEFVTPVL